MKKLLSMEPTRLISLLRAGLLVAVAFGLPISDGQTQALIGLAVAGLALGEVNRAAVVPVKKVESVARDVGGNAIKLANRLTGKENDGD